MFRIIMCLPDSAPFIKKAVDVFNRISYTNITTSLL